jgi:hypothetical protein
MAIRYGKSLDQGGGRWSYRRDERIHLCAPPRIYADDLKVGPLIPWLCNRCERIWIPYGVQFVDGHYPVAPGGNDRLIGPLQWLLSDHNTEAFPGEQGLYDFRPTAVAIMQDVLPALSELAESIRQSK